MFKIKRTDKRIRGVWQPQTPLGDLEKKGVAILVSLPERRSVRYRCARISNKNWEEKDGLKEIIEKQFVGNMSWANFLIIWDIAQDDPYKVIKK